MNGAPKAEPLTQWAEVVAAFDSFPAPKLEFDFEGEISRETWVFRGHQNALYQLEPSIERAAKGKTVSWAALESMILDEFRAKARMHMDVSDLPLEQKLSWLATMQHYGVPTRLLDFTYSPYVALYFALRNCPDHSAPAAVWAIDVQTLLEVSQRTSRRADIEEREYIAQTTGERPKGRRASLDTRFFATDHDRLKGEGEYWIKALSSALTPDGIRRDCFNKKGFVAFALPPVQNHRLSSQQGAFLLNGAEELSFEQSLFKMMSQADRRWCRLFEVSAKARTDLERKLFQMNIHDLSLFPDVEGLAGFIRQKVRLHWVPNDTDS
jgi:hypothetical protein